MSFVEVLLLEGLFFFRVREEGEEELGNGNEDEDEIRVEMINFDGIGVVWFFCGLCCEMLEMCYELWKFEEWVKKFVEEVL